MCDESKLFAGQAVMLHRFRHMLPLLVSLSRRLTHATRSRIPRIKGVRLWLAPALPLESALYHQIIMRISWEVMPVSSGLLPD